MRADRTTLAQFLAAKRLDPRADAELNGLILDLALACRAMAKTIGRLAPSLDTRTPSQRDPGAAAHPVFLRAFQGSARFAGVMSARMDAPYIAPADQPTERYLLLFEPLEQPSNLDINAAGGSIFSILRVPHAGAVTPADFLQPGSAQICAGYALYGAATVFVLSLGAGVHAFTLAPRLGEFVLTHPALHIPSVTSDVAFNAANGRFWEPAVKRYVSECVAGATGLRGKDFDMHWTGSLVAETHRLLMRGGVCLCPRDDRSPATSSRLHQLCQANPVSFLVEQAGGRASTARERVLTLIPRELHQQTGLILGSRFEVERLEQYHQNHDPSGHDAPLFGLRGLFRAVN